MKRYSCQIKNLVWVTLTLLTSRSSSLVRGEAEVTRDHYGDVFSPSKMDCNETMCDQNGRQSALVPGRSCECQCAPSYPTFREDVEECVRDITECPLAFFVRTFTTERIPMVFLPMTGQLVNSGAHLAISAAAAAATGGNNKSNYLCGVNSTEVMSENGWESMAHLEKRHPLFAIYQDGKDNKSFLQWLGDDNTRAQLQNRLVLIYFQCKDSNRKGNELVHLCVAVRVGWSPGLDLAGTVPKPKSNHFMIIGLCLGILGLVYVLALLVYLKIRQAKKLEREALAASLPITPENPPDNDECITTITNDLFQFPSVLRESLKASTTSEERRSKRLHSKSSSKTTTTVETHTNRSNGKTTSNGNVSSSPSSGRFTDPNNSGYPGSQDIKVSRRNLYLHPELFEPEMLVSPPLPALEFLQRIREMITNARARLRNFRFRPTLVVIPEDDYFYQDSKDRDPNRGNHPRSSRKRSETSQEVVENGGPATTYSTKTKEYSSESIHGSGIGAVIVEYRVDTPPTPPKAYKMKQRRAPQPPVAKPTNTGEPSEVKADSPKVSTSKSTGSTPDILPVVTQIAQDNINKFDMFRRDLYNKLTTMYSEERNGKSRHSRSSRASSVVDSLTDPQNNSFDSVKRKSKSNKFVKDQAPKEPPHIYTTPETVIKTEDIEDKDSGVLRVETVVQEAVVEEIQPEEVEIFVDEPPPQTLYVTVDVEVIPDNVSDVKESPLVSKDEIEVNDLSRCQTNPQPEEVVILDSTPSTPYDSLNSVAARRANAANSIERFRDRKCLRERGAKNICLIRDGVLSTGTENQEVCDCEKCYQVSTEDMGASNIDESCDDPSLEEYLQLSDRVAQKLSERSVPYLGSSNQSSPEVIPKEKSKNLSWQFVKDIRVTLNKIGGHFDMPKYSRSGPVQVKTATSAVEHNNWMLKKEDSSVMGHGKKIIRKISMKNKKLANKIGRKFLHHPKNVDDACKENCGDEATFEPVAETTVLEIGTCEPTYEPCGSTGASESSGDSKDTIIDRNADVQREENESTNATNGTLERSRDDNESVATSKCYSFEVDSLQRPNKDLELELRSDNASISEASAGIYEGDSIETESIYAPGASDLTDDSLNVNRDGPPSMGNDFSLEYESDMEPLEACLNLLANTPLELVVGGRASKGLDITEHFKSAQWEHICHDTKPGDVNNVPALKVSNLRRKQTSPDMDEKLKNDLNVQDLNPETDIVNGYHENGGNWIVNGSGGKPFIRNKKSGKLSDALSRYKNGSSVRQRLPSNNSGSDDESVKTDANSNYYSVIPAINNATHDHVIHVDNGKNDFVTLIAVQPAPPCSS